MTRPARLAPMDLEPDAPPEYSHDEFYDNVLHIRPDEHALWLGKTGAGKTTGMLRAASVMARLYPHVEYTALIGKPSRGPHYRGRKATGDETVSRLVRKYRGRIQRDHPFLPLMPGRTRPAFTALWPLTTDDPRVDGPRAAGAYERYLLHRYARGGGTTIVDELVYIDDECGLADLTDHQYRMGRGMDAPIWAGSQMPTHLNRKAISMASHLILSFDNDKDARRRYSEISAIDTDLAMWQMRRIQRYGKFAALYIHPDGPEGPEWAVIR